LNESVAPATELETQPRNDALPESFGAMSAAQKLVIFLELAGLVIWLAASAVAIFTATALTAGGCSDPGCDERVGTALLVGVGLHMLAAIGGLILAFKAGSFIKRLVSLLIVGIATPLATLGIAFFIVAS
jgi:hypothetical protein